MIFHNYEFSTKLKNKFQKKHGNPECDKKHKKNRCIAATIL